MELHNLMGFELIEKIKNKEIKIEALINTKFDRIESIDSSLHSFVRLSKDSAIKKAKKLDGILEKNKDIGRLFGSPITIEEGISVNGELTTCCSKILEGYIPSFHATVVEKIVEQQNGIFIGRTNMDEFGLGNSTESSCYGPTRNPWNSDYVPGGASGGAGASIASGLAPFAIGSDTGGSLRCVASFCGVVGLRPTYGRVSKHGLASYSHSLEQIGPITKCVQDSALLLELISGNDPLEATTSNEPVENFSEGLNQPIKNKLIGVPKEISEEKTDPKVKETVGKMTELLKDLGCKVIEVSLPHFDYALSSYLIIAISEASSNLAKYDGLRYGKMSADLNGDIFEIFSRTRGEKFNEEAKMRVMLGSYLLTEKYYQMFYIKAMKARTLIKNDFQAALKKCNVIVCPTTPFTAFKFGSFKENPLERYKTDVFTTPVSLSGLPALSIPCGFDNNNLPIGFQIIGNYFKEKEILNIGYLLEQKSELYKNMPPIKKGGK